MRAHLIAPVSLALLGGIVASGSAAPNLIAAPAPVILEECAGCDLLGNPTGQTVNATLQTPIPNSNPVAYATHVITIVVTPDSTTKANTCEGAMGVCDEATCSLSYTIEINETSDPSTTELGGIMLEFTEEGSGTGTVFLVDDIDAGMADPSMTVTPSHRCNIPASQVARNSHCFGLKIRTAPAGSGWVGGVGPDATVTFDCDSCARPTE